MKALNNFLTIGLPYMAILICVVGCIYRYRSMGFKFSSLSTQFLDSEKLFFGSMMFHWSILMVFLGHLVGFLFPGLIVSLGSNPQNLVIFEMVGFTFGMGTVFGLVWLFLRRIGNDRVQMVTNQMDIVIELLIIVQCVLGVFIAFSYRWGSIWFASDLSPYLWSVLALNPQTAAVTAMPVAVLIHVVVAFVILGMIPFTRLVHFLVAPFSYIPRPYQQVIWNWNRNHIRNTNTAWSEARPKNN